MKQTKIERYEPNYPKKLIRGAAITAAALVAMSGAACKPLPGCTPMPEPTPEELVLDGEIAIDESENPDDLMLGGEPLSEEKQDDPSQTRDNGPELMGKIAVPEDTGNP